ncbi:hypothetical protein CYMTET_36727, partial [Cymbomonas tetramitiformis]
MVKSVLRVRELLGLWEPCSRGVGTNMVKSVLCVRELLGLWEPCSHMPAASNGDFKMLQALLKHGKGEIDLNVRAESTGRTALWVACNHGHHDVVQLLLTQSSVDVNLADDAGATPLQIVAQNGQ